MYFKNVFCLITLIVPIDSMIALKDITDNIDRGNKAIIGVPVNIVLCIGYKRLRGPTDFRPIFLFTV